MSAPHHQLTAVSLMKSAMILVTTLSGVLLVPIIRLSCLSFVLMLLE